MHQCSGRLIFIALVPLAGLGDEKRQDRLSQASLAIWFTCAIFKPISEIGDIQSEEYINCKNLLFWGFLLFGTFCTVGIFV